MSKGQEVQGAQTLDRAFQILRLVADYNHVGIRLVDLTRLSGLTQPTSHRLIRALEQHGYVERDAESGLFHLGRELFALGSMASGRYDLRRLTSRSLVRLAQQTGDTVLLTVRQGWHALCVAREEGDFPIRSQVTRVGHRQPLGISAGGMAILAALPDDEMEEAISVNRAEIAEKFPKFSEDMVRDCVRAAREKGYSFNPGLVFPGSWGVAVAILPKGRACLGAITIAGIAERFDRGRQIDVARMIGEEIQGIESAFLA